MSNRALPTAPPCVMENFTTVKTAGLIHADVLDKLELAEKQPVNYRKIATYTPDGRTIYTQKGTKPNPTRPFSDLSTSILDLHIEYNELLIAHHQPPSDVIELLATNQEMPRIHQDNSAQGLTGFFYGSGADGFEIVDENEDLKYDPFNCEPGRVMPALEWHRMPSVCARTLVSMFSYDPTR